MAETAASGPAPDKAAVDSEGASTTPRSQQVNNVRRVPQPPPIDLSASRLRANKRALAGVGRSSALPPPLKRNESERLLAETHKRLSSKVEPFSNVHLSMAAMLGAASQLFFFAISHVWQPKHRGLAFLWNALSLRFLPSALGSGWLVSALVGALAGAAMWSVVVHVLLPVYRLHLKRRTVWPLSCEAIRVSDPQWAAQWEAWARGIDANNTDAAVADEWGAMTGATALRMMAAYQDDDAFEKQNAQFICLRYFPTPPPNKKYTSWFDYFRRRRASPSPPATDAATVAAPQSSPDPSATPADSTTPPVSGLPLQTPALTPYPDLVSLRTPALATPWVRSGGASSAPPHGVPIGAPDDTVALVFLTVLPNYNLRPYLPRLVADVLALGMAGYRKLRGVEHAGAPQSVWSLSMSLGLVGFQFPFRTGVFFTRKLSFYEPYAKAFTKAAADAEKTNGNIAGVDNPMNPDEREARTARYALLLQVLTEWNVSRRVDERVDLLFHATPTSSVSAAATRRVHMLPISVPPSYIADMRPWSGAKWSAYTASLRKEGKRVREAPFEKAGGTAEFTSDASMAATAVEMWTAVAKKQAETGGSHPTLLQPSEGWLQKLLEPLTDGNKSESSSASSPSNSLAQILQLRLPQGLAATSVVCQFGRYLLTSDVAGFDYPLLAEVERDEGHKVALYSNKLANVLRRAIAQGVQFVDFGPTTGEPKRQLGCQTVPLYGAAICAQVHLLWLARAAASVVAINQQLPQLLSATNSMLRRTMQRARSGSLLPVQSPLTANGAAAASSSTSPSAATSIVKDSSPSQRSNGTGGDAAKSSSALRSSPSSSSSAAAKIESAAAAAAPSSKESDAARSQQKQQERAARKEARRKRMEQQHKQRQQEGATADEKPQQQKNQEQPTAVAVAPAADKTKVSGSRARSSSPLESVKEERATDGQSAVGAAAPATTASVKAAPASSSPSPAVDAKLSDAERSKLKQQERAARKEAKRRQMEEAQKAAREKQAAAAETASNEQTSGPADAQPSSSSSSSSVPQSSASIKEEGEEEQKHPHAADDRKEMAAQQVRKGPTEWSALKAELQQTS